MDESVKGGGAKLSIMADMAVRWEGLNVRAGGLVAAISAAVGGRTASAGKPGRREATLLGLRLAVRGVLERHRV